MKFLGVALLLAASGGLWAGIVTENVPQEPAVVLTIAAFASGAVMTFWAAGQKRKKEIETYEILFETNAGRITALSTPDCAAATSTVTAITLAIEQIGSK